MCLDRSARLSWPVLASLSLLGILFIIQCVLAVLRQPSLIWNEIRWCRSLALSRGLPIYVGEHSAGPIIGTLHPPLSHLVYRVTVGWLGDPVEGILAGSLVSFAIVFGVVAWLFVRARSPGSHGWTGVAVIFLFCGFAIMQSPAAYDTVTAIHTDACALAFSIIACGLVCLRPDARAKNRIWLSALCVVLSICSKQTMVPVAVAVGAFILMADGFVAFAHFVVAGVAAAAIAICLVIAFYPGPVVFFNLVTLAVHRAYKPDALSYLARAFRDGKLDSLTALFPTLFFLVYEWREAGRKPSGFRFLNRNRWLVFMFAAASLAPGTIVAILSSGADINHVGLMLVLLFAGAGLAIQQNLSASDPLLRRSALLFAAVGLLVNVTPAAALELPAAWNRLEAADSEIAFKYALRHPRQAYFPWNPSVSLLTQGKLYHLDPALADREIAGYPLIDSQVLSGLPEDFQYVVIPPGMRLTSQRLSHVFAHYRSTTISELPGWTIYGK
jgi:hypothetical protein